MADRIRLQWGDWLQMLLFTGLGWLVAFGLSLLLVSQLLAQPMVEEVSQKVELEVNLAEKILPLLPADQPSFAGLPLHQGEQPPAGSSLDLDRFGKRLLADLSQHHQLNRRLALDSRRGWHPFPGYWVQLRNGAGAPSSWLHLPAQQIVGGLFWPLVMAGTALAGTPLGLLLFMQQRLLRPLNQLIRELPDQSRSSMELVPEQGLGPLRAFAVRINRLLDQINTNSASRHNLLRGLVHDLRGPLTRISLRLEGLEANLSQPGPEVIAALRKDSQDLQALAQQLAALASQETIVQGSQDLALDDFCARIASTYPASAVELRVPRLLVRLNPALLQRSLNNLIDNALEYGKPPVVISVCRDAKALLIQVEDHGNGLATTNLLGNLPPPRASDRQRRQHFGIGLAIVERFCRDHGGRLQLDCSAYGGLKAELQLPLDCIKYAGLERRQRRQPSASEGYKGPDRRGSLWGPLFNSRQ
ncbi:MAG: HAMP domain-containing sensor histidine kinase [Prochlorococcaceae cyanobacterium]